MGDLLEAVIDPAEPATSVEAGLTALCEGRASATRCGVRRCSLGARLMGGMELPVLPPLLSWQ